MDHGNEATAYFLEYSTRHLRTLTERIEACLGKLNSDQIWARGSQNENAVGNLALHLSGNVRQWIVSGVGGRPDTRDRNSEFDARSGADGPELIGRLRSTVEEAIAVIEGLTPARLCERLTIQKIYEVTVLEAVYHVVEHYAMHTGQIIFATKMLTGGDLEFYKHLREKTAGQN